MPAQPAEVDLLSSRHRAAPYAERADQADHVRRSTLQGKRCCLPAAERRKPFSGKHLLDAGPPYASLRTSHLRIRSPDTTREDRSYVGSR